MARPKREFPFTVGVFGIPAKIINSEVCIKVNVRGDQENQRNLAKLDPASTVLLVDCAGGAVGNEDAGIDDAALAREIAEETGGCTMTPLEPQFRPPFALLSKEDGKPGDLAFWKPI